MNKKQYNAAGWFFLIFGFLLYIKDLIITKPLLFSLSEGWILTNSLAPSSQYIITKSAIEANLIIIFIALGILFFILEKLGDKKK